MSESCALLLSAHRRDLCEIAGSPASAYCPAASLAATVPRSMGCARTEWYPGAQSSLTGKAKLRATFSFRTALTTWLARASSESGSLGSALG